MNYKALKKLDEVVNGLYQKDVALKNTKFGYAYKRFFEKNLKPIKDELNDKVNLCWVENALEGRDKEVLVDRTNQRGFKFSKEGLIKVLAEEKKLVEEYDLKEVKIDPYVPSYIPNLSNLNQEEEVELLKIFTEK